jgi:hypothetical protein
VSNRSFYLFLLASLIAGGVMLWIAIDLIDVYAFD